MTRRFKIIVQRSEEGYVAYPLGLKGVVVSDGDTFEEALDNVRSAIAFHIETFGSEVLEEVAEPGDIYIAEAEVALDA
jgi:predicted RNase H-like HicB family nuclease